MASLRSALLAAAIGGMTLVAAATYLERQAGQKIIAAVGEQELTLAAAAQTYVKNDAQAAGGIVDIGTLSLTNGQYGALPASVLSSNNLVSTDYTGNLANGGQPTIVLRNEYGGIAIVVADSVSEPDDTAYAFLEQSAYLGKGTPNGGLFALGGMFQGLLSDYGLAPPNNGATFIPLAVSWVSSQDIS